MEGSGEFFPQSSTKLAVVDTNGDGRQELIGPTADGKPGDVGLNALGGSESVPTNLRGDEYGGPLQNRARFLHPIFGIFELLRGDRRKALDIFANQIGAIDDLGLFGLGFR